MSAVTGISGIQLSAASAAFAPTNSADVSAIASAYQVVSATATQLNAGTAYLTSVNETPVSATRAGNAANASLATSAWYDGTGRLISALPDEAAVSSIASAYAESAASSKQDTLSFSYDDDKISAINGSALAGQGGGGEQVVTATGSASVTAGWFPVTTSYLVSSINGSAILPYGFTVLSGNSADWTYASNTVKSNSAKWDSVYNTVSGNSASWGQGEVDSATVSAIASSYAESAVSSKLDESATADFYTTANPSGFITGVDLTDYATTAYVDSAVSSKADSSALSSYALSADVSGTVDLVSTQSANWGGSALALSAGPGISLSKSGDTLIVSTDETVLWSGTPVTVADATTGLPLAESPYNFDRVALYWVPWNYTVNSLEKQEAVAEARITSAIPRIGSVTEWNAEASNTTFIFVLNAYFDSSKFYTQAIKYFSIGDWAVNTQGTGSYITKIVGINRTAEA